MLKRVNPGRVGFLAVFALVAMLALAACGDDSDTGSETASGGDTSASEGGGGTIGGSILNLRDPDLAVMGETMEETATADGVELILVDAKGDTAVELSQVEDLITRDVEAVIMQPIDGEQSQTAAERVNEADIPLFLLSTEFAPDSTAETVAYIGVDDTEAGEMQAEYVNEQLPQGGKIIYIVGTYGASWTDRRKEGFEKVINPNIEVADELQANGDRAEAKRTMEDLLQKYDPGDIDGVVTHNDEMAIGAGSAIAEANELGDYKFIVGVDGTQPGLEAIANGEMTATVLQRSAEQGEKAIDVVAEFLEGAEVEERYDLPFTLVTDKNVKEFLK